VGTLTAMISEKHQMRRPHKSESNDVPLRDGPVSSSDEGSVMGLERRDRPGSGSEHQRNGRSAHEQERKYAICKREVLLAWQKVRKKGGIGGVDGIGIKDFEMRLEDNLYKIWNRMSSGSYHPKAVSRVEIPKADGGKRPLGIPTIQDRVAQEVVRARLEPVVEGFFHPDSYGFRPKKSGLEAIETCRQRCWKYDWVLDVDIQKFFDTVDHELMMKAVRKHCEERWILLYIERWLKAPVQHKDGRLEASPKGTPQGGVISPLLANLYLHYTFDSWMRRTFPHIVFERYADDIVIHCRDQEETEKIRELLAERLLECGLTLHPEKTKVVYCKDYARKGMYPTKKFTFLGYSFQPRSASKRSDRGGKKFTGYLPAVSKEAGKKFRDRIKELRVLKQTQHDIDHLVSILDPMIRGWYNYFSRFYSSALRDMTEWLDNALVRWLRRKFRLSWSDSRRLLVRLRRENPTRFHHWKFRTLGRAV